MHEREPVSDTHQMYLKALLRLSRDRHGGRVRDLARELGITPGTVSAGLNRLDDLGLVARERYGAVSLTPAGEAIARCVVRRFETLRALLVDVLGVDEDTAERDACRMEHAVGPGTVNRMAALVGHVRSGATFDRDSLRGALADISARCSECEAAGVCQAAAHFEGSEP